MHKTNSHLAHTIPEMLAVVALMVIIIALLLPALGGAKDTAHNAICMSNLHQQGLGLIGYAVTSGYYPGAHTWTHDAPQYWIIWPSRIREYMNHQDTEWFWCPIAPDKSQWTVSFGSGLNNEYGYQLDETRLLWSTPFSYGYNNWGSTDFSIPQVGLGGLSEHKDWGRIEEIKSKTPLQYGCTRRCPSRWYLGRLHRHQPGSRTSSQPPPR